MKGALKIIGATLSLAVVLGAGFFVYQHMLRTSSSEQSVEKSEIPTEFQSREELPKVTPSDAESVESEHQTEERSNITSHQGKVPTADDCENECEGYALDDAEQKYCLAYCGLHQETLYQSGCEALTGQEKDFCLKDKALKEKNPETCATISDSALRKSCEARIAEELFD